MLGVSESINSLMILMGYVRCVCVCTAVIISVQSSENLVAAKSSLYYANNNNNNNNAAHMHSLAISATT